MHFLCRNCPANSQEKEQEVILDESSVTCSYSDSVILVTGSSDSWQTGKVVEKSSSEPSEPKQCLFFHVVIVVISIG